MERAVECERFKRSKRLRGLAAPAFTMKAVRKADFEGRKRGWPDQIE